MKWSSAMDEKSSGNELRRMMASDSGMALAI